MKKYVKPEIFYEVFELSQHIADCTYEWENMVDPAYCYALPDLEKLPFLEGTDSKVFVEYGVCTHLRGDLEEFCYQNGAPHQTLFTS